jgi:hypothetical protein
MGEGGGEKWGGGGVGGGGVSGWGKVGVSCSVVLWRGVVGGDLV